MIRAWIRSSLRLHRVGTLVTVRVKHSILFWLLPCNSDKKIFVPKAELYFQRTEFENTISED